MATITAMTSQNYSSVPRIDICRIVQTMLLKMGVPYSVTSYEQRLHDICVKRAFEEGYPMSSDPSEISLRPFIPGGVAMAMTAYAHLEDEATRVYIVFFTAFFLAVDDLYERDNDAVQVFIGRFIRGEKQPQPILDSMAKYLQDTPNHFEPVVANLVLTSGLNLVNAAGLEYMTRSMKPSLSAQLYPAFSRQMSAAAEAYALMAFPRHIPMMDYIQCIPEACGYVAYANDALSFYKEEMRGETTNYISVLARCASIPKRAALQRTANDVSRLDAQVNQILRDSPDALNAWNSFKSGYVDFHVSLDRYRLAEIMGCGLGSGRARN